MKREPKIQAQDAEPVGIVISRGSRNEPSPTFLAFEWSMADSTVDTTEHKAA